jgi:hypothetical protein
VCWTPEMTILLPTFTSTFAASVLEVVDRDN